MSETDNKSKIDATVAYAEEIRALAEELLSLKEKNTDCLIKLKDTLVLTGNKLKELGKQGSFGSGQSVHGNRLIVMGENLCALAGKVHMHIFKSIRKSEDNLVRLKDFKKRNDLMDL